MKETGIVRRIDELGRVVIPKEIRRTLRLKESDPLEIFTDRDMLCFKKYSPVSSVGEIAESLCASLAEMTGRLALVVDTDVVLSAKGAGAKELFGKTLLPEVTDVLAARQAAELTEETDGSVKAIVEGGVKRYPDVVIAPAVAGGDLFGGVILCGDKRCTGDEVRLTKMCADILSRQF